MALSGSFSTNVGSHWRVYCTWSGTQSISGNYTDVTLKSYWEATSSHGAVRSTATKNGSASINGSSGSFTFSAGLSGSQRKLVNTRNIRVNHNSDGSKSGVSLSATLGVNVTLSGTYYGSVTASTTVTLNIIPRASSISSNANWTAGSNKTVTISRASTSFTHTVRWQVQDTGGTWRTIKTSTGVGTSVSSSFTTAQNKDIFNRMAQNATRPSRIQIETFSGSTSIGGTISKTGTVTAPSASTVKITNPAGVSSTSGQGNSTVYIDQNVQVSITRSNSNFTHTLRFKDGNSGSTIYTATGVGTSHTWNPTTAHRNHMYGKIPNGIEFDGQIDIITYYDGIQVRGTGNTDINYRVKQSVSKPTFSASSISYLDTNSKTTGITGNNQYIVQGQSQFRASINSGATAKNSATISSYEVKINGVTKSRTGTGVVDMGAVNTSSNTTMTITAIDSRGFRTTVSKTVNMIPYSPPTISATAERLNGFEAQTTLKVRGSVSAIKVGASNRNSISIARRRHKVNTTSTYGGWSNLSVTGIPNYTASNVNLTLSNSSSWDIQVQITDRLTTTIRDIKVPAGRPILYLDSDLKAIGIGDFPKSEYELRINGRIVFGAEFWASGNGSGEGTGALDMNNSDIVGANGIYFNDVANNDGEGLLFMKSGKTSGSTNRNDYDTFYIRDGVYYHDNYQIMRYEYGNTAGSFIGLGAGGTTAVGSGESIDELLNSAGFARDEEKLHLASDGEVLLHSNMQAGWGARRQWVFRTDGTLRTPGDIDLGGSLLLNNASITAPSSGLRLDATSGFVAVGSVNGHVYAQSGGSGNELRVTEHMTASTYKPVRASHFRVNGGVEVLGNSLINDNSGLFLGSGKGFVNMGGGNAVMRLGTTVWQGGTTNSGLLYLGRDGTGERIWSHSIYNRTYGSASNMFVTGEGTIGRSTSATKYKLNIKEIEDNGIEERIMSLNPKKWNDKSAVEGYAEYLTKIHNNEDAETDDVPYLQTHYGLIAEDLIDAGLGMFVQYGAPNEYGVREVEGIEYDRLWVLLIPIVRKQKNMIDMLDSRLAYLESKDIKIG